MECGNDRCGKGSDGEGDRKIPTIEYHHQGERHRSRSAGGERADSEPNGLRLVGGRDLVKAFDNEIEGGCHEDRK